MRIRHDKFKDIIDIDIFKKDYCKKCINFMKNHLKNIVMML